jgi:xanthine dehydrogenase accessory factor
VPHILIAGGGHCGLAIAATCDNLGWSHSVFDVRNEYADGELYPKAVEHHSSDVKGFIASLSDNGFMRFSDVLLLGHDWSVDQDLLIGLLLNRGEENRPRIGAIGSRAKWKVFREAAISAGVSENAIDSVRCPIGIQIGAESPEEIAIAVCAEIMAIEKGVQE